MAPKTRSSKDIEEAAMILLNMADPSWNAPDADEDKENDSREFKKETSKSSGQQIEHAKTLSMFSQATVVHSATPSQSSSTSESQSVTAPSSQHVSSTTSQTSRAASRTDSAMPSRAVSVASTSSSTSTSTPSLTTASLAALTVEQRALQQQRFAMTSQERAALNLKAYCHYDLSNNQIGILWQTKIENRTFRQTQRRQGAVRLRAGTTTGLKFPRRRA
jgi:hypothetical protein